MRKTCVQYLAAQFFAIWRLYDKTQNLSRKHPRPETAASAVMSEVHFSLLATAMEGSALACHRRENALSSISGPVVEYIAAIDVPRSRFSRCIL